MTTTTTTTTTTTSGAADNCTELNTRAGHRLVAKIKCRDFAA